MGVSLNRPGVRLSQVKPTGGLVPQKLYPSTGQRPVLGYRNKLPDNWIWTSDPKAVHKLLMNLCFLFTSLCNQQAVRASEVVVLWYFWQQCPWRWLNWAEWFAVLIIFLLADYLVSFSSYIILIEEHIPRIQVPKGCHQGWLSNFLHEHWIFLCDDTSPCKSLVVTQEIQIKLSSLSTYPFQERFVWGLWSYPPGS